MKKQKIKTIQSLSLYELEELLTNIMVERHGENHFVQIDVYSYEDEDFTIRVGLTANVLIKTSEE